MDFSLTKGFASLNNKDTTARSTYIEQLPILAECLSFQHFMSEFEIVLRSILQYPNLVQKLIKTFPLILQFFDKEHQYHIIYESGTNLRSFTNNNIENELMRFLVEMLQEMNDIAYEYEKYLEPAIKLKPDKSCEIAIFPYMRLACLTAQYSDCSPFEKLIYKLFSDKSTFTAVSSVLYLMHLDIVKQYLIEVLKSSDERNRIAAIHAIEEHEIDTENETINELFEKEKS